MTVTITINYLPANDGLDHINVYSKGQTFLGRLLSNFAHTPFTCEDGKFASIEGYWYWLSIVDKKEREVLRTLHGYEAKEVGRKLRTDQFGDNVDAFKRKICKAIKIKIEAHNLDKLLAETDLPLTHYYLYGKKRVEGGGEWIIVFLERLRTKYKQQIGED